MAAATKSSPVAVGSIDSSLRRRRRRLLHCPVLPKKEPQIERDDDTASPRTVRGASPFSPEDFEYEDRPYGGLYMDTYSHASFLGYVKPFETIR